MGAGKSTAARALGPDSVDVDHEIERRDGRRVAEIFNAEGEQAFRRLEETTTLELLGRPDVHVLALGGGALGSAAIRQALEPHTVIWLDIDPDLAWRRVHGGSTTTKRPLAADQNRFFSLHAQRQAEYEAAADVVVPATRARDIPRVVQSLAGLPEPGAGPGQVKTLWAAGSSGDYPVHIGRGLLTQTEYWPAQLEGRRVVVADYNSARHYSDHLAPFLADIRIMPGEQSKTIAHAEIVWTEMARNGVTRADVVAALGGGVVGDLAGFCAATYQRGIAVVQIPTTLVAQVDSAYGGKTGVDLAEAKNYVGAYHPPAAVIVDPTTLRTLPPEELAAGYAEVVKTALIAGGTLWDQVAAGAPPADAEVITNCALTKLRVVAQDERDGGPRQLLNLGHTIGHALETVTGYARFRHGEAVGLGLLAALRLSGADALRDQVAELLDLAGLPTHAGADLDPEQVIFATARDKKRVGEGPTPFVLCPEPGAAAYGQTVSPADLRRAVNELISVPR
ncbi:MAG: bifunctional shikimate kinase/3-dehydroquinate synthase [Solirubrobacterales bacterium]|nr:bifunctional shikimate kinase/3-dehydroquinate synthase [Solirubrobacterales bacterium]